jgi:glycosyltransferase involved in cell wall biosynthesis
MNNPWLSVLMPVYNGEEYLAQALDSIVIQSDKDIECIVVDDGSTDGTPAILDSYKKKMSLEIIHRSHSGNWAANTNIALAKARGGYVCILHQDDLWLDGRLQAIKKLIAQYPNANMILHPVRFIDIKGGFLGLWRCPLPVLPYMISANTMTARLLVQNFISIPSPVFKREAAINAGGLDDKLWYTPDWDFWLKMASYGKVIYYPGILTAFRIHPKAQTVVRSVSITDFRKELETVYNRHMQLWQTAKHSKYFVRGPALFSIEMNVALAAMLHNKKWSALKLLWFFVKIGPLGWYCYLRDSRIMERISARARMRALIPNRAD